VKSFLALTLLSFGTPMLLMGDEVRRSQQGNNNAYGQDNELSWFDWTLLGKHPDVHRFVKELIRLRLHFDKASLEYDLTLTQFLAQAKIDWHGVTLHEPDRGVHSHSLAATTVSLTGSRVFHLICNAYWEPLSFQLPQLPDNTVGEWRRHLDTALPSPMDICGETEAGLLEESMYLAQPRSVVLLFANIGQAINKATNQESTQDARK
jgi:glycogen operon protein